MIVRLDNAVQSDSIPGWCRPAVGTTSEIKSDTVEINREIIILWLNIMSFRTQSISNGTVELNVYRSCEVVN